jgi:succinate dehydrogenase / fumarate reductase, cytochrome b subunit
MATAFVSNQRRRPFLVEFYRSAVGKKYAMAVTGVGLMGFVIAHMIGNLKMYLGRMPATSEYAYHIDEYGHFLRVMGEPIFPKGVLLWLLRIGLIVMFVVHMHAAYSLTMMNRRARVTSYQSKRDYLAANFASRTMRWTGIIVILFVLFHLGDLTWGTGVIASDSWKYGTVYANVDASLSRPIVAVLYIVANLALGTHLFHGAWSFFQSLGWNNPRFNAVRKKIAYAIAGLVVVGNLSFPLAVLAGVISVN